MNTYHIHINGIVQGVGFRPFVYQLAKAMQLNGYIKNGNDGVHVFFNADEEAANVFFKKIKQKAPQKSKIISSHLYKVESKSFDDFSIIIEEDNHQDKRVLLSPDVALCDNCRNELHEVNNRRFRYPFITCTQCGPRYSIIKDIPYDRDNTSYENHPMCDVCFNEYENVTDKRFFSQTNSCCNCGLELTLLNSNHSIVSDKSNEVSSLIKIYLEQGKILAVKGIGGYLFLCNANDEKAIQTLRKRKHRRSKPLAVLYPDIKNIEENFELNDKEKILLQSAEAPIVLLYPKQKAFENISINNIAPQLKRVGVMLPYSPLLDLIANDFGKPLIATSANISGSPIIYKDDDELKYFFDIADFVITYNRDIIIPEDDSVVQVSKYSQQQIILRRSRGYAPSFLHYKPNNQDCILSTGAHLKSSFTLSVNGNVFISQFLGSGESYESQQIYKTTLKHWLKLYNAKPTVILTDKHPNYFSHQYANELTEQFNVEVKYVQHHEAHFAAVLAENNLMQNEDAILGIIWDGTGLGNDGNIWGGEFFKYENNEMLRCYHFDYFPSIAGDKIALEPRIAALCTTSDVWHSGNIVKEKFTIVEWNTYQSLIEQTNIFSSSVGRIFDAVASLLNICDKQTYEGEAAMYLQSLAEEYVDENGFEMNESYFKEGSHYYRIPTATLMQSIIIDMEKGKDKNYIAAKFHYSLVCLIDIVAKHLQIEKICFSGGVFQNALLIDWIQHKLSNKYHLYFHQHLSPNDENISFGQLVYYDNDIRTAETKTYKEQELITHHS